MLPTPPFTFSGVSIPEVETVAGKVASAYRQILNASGRHGESGSAATKYLFHNETKTSPEATTDGGLAGAHYLYFVPADHAVSGKTTKLMVRAHRSGALASVTFKIALFPVTVAEAKLTLGALVTGSTVELVNPEQLTVGTSGDFTPPAEGLYMFGWEVSGNPGVGAPLSAQLYVRNV